jgi:hypothetical protein
MTPSSPLPMLDFDAVEQRLRSAEKRRSQLVGLNGGDLPGADADERQQLVQEFFFHLLGAVDVFAQYVAEQRGLKTAGNRSMGSLVGNLPQKNIPAADPLGVALRLLYVNTDKVPLPAYPYSDEGYLYRAYNYRHQVTHRRANPWLFRMWDRTAVFLLDPREPAGDGPNHSTKTYDVEMTTMFQLISDRITAAKALV